MKKWTNLFLTQFLGVFNDNFLKSLISFISVLWLVDGDQSTIISLASALLVLPFILFSPYAGLLARTKSKRKVVVTAKFMEIPIMIMAAAGFYFEEVWIVMAALFFMGLQSALFSPSKYGLIRDIGGPKGLSFGAGTMEMLSFLAVLMGTVVAGVVSDLSQGAMFAIVGGLVGVAGLGWLASRQIKAEEETVEQMPKNFIKQVNPLAFVRDSFNWSKGTKGLNTTVLGLSVFWFIGSMLQMNLIIFCPEQIGFTNTQTSIVIAFVAIGIGLGCWVAGLISGSRVELGLVPIGGLGLSLFLSLLTIQGLPPFLFITFLMLAAFFSGWFKVPLNAWIQERVKGRMLGNILAYNNIVVFLFILFSAVIFGYTETNFGSPAVFKVIAVCSWIVTAITLWKIPAMLVRFVFYILAHTIYKIRIKGADQIPTDSGALLIANHISLLDSILIVASVPRMVRFVVHRKVYELKFLTWIFKKFSVIPVESGQGPEAMERFNTLCIDEINKGHIVCIFPEGQISRTGHLHAFKKGIEHIASGIEAPVIPLFMDNVIGSPFSYKSGTNRTYKLGFKSLKRSINVIIGYPLPQPLRSFEGRQALQDLSIEVFHERLSNQDLSLELQSALKEYGNQSQVQLEDGTMVSKNQFLGDALNGEPIEHKNSEYPKLVSALRDILLSNENNTERDQAILSGILGFEQTHDLTKMKSIKSLHDISNPFGFISKVCWPILLNKILVLGDLPTISPNTILIGATELLQDYLKIVPIEEIGLIMTGPYRIDSALTKNIKDVQNRLRVGLIAGPYSMPISLNTENYSIPDLMGRESKHQGTKAGTVGRVIPGVSAKIIGSLGELATPSQKGKLLLKGPSLGSMEWIVSEYTASMDEEGFITLYR